MYLQWDGSVSAFQLASYNTPESSARRRAYTLQQHCSPIESVAAITDKHRVAKQLPALQLQKWT